MEDADGGDGCEAESIADAGRGMVMFVPDVPQG